MSLLMSSTLEIAERSCFKNVYRGRNNNTRKCLKVSSNVCKRKCSKALKKKLKKYKIKHGEEDPDVLDVSKSLTTSLIIKSPNSQNIPKFEIELDECDYIKPKNYLFKKMGNRKKCNILTESNRKVIEDHIKSDIMQHPIHIDSEQNHTNAFKLLMDSRNKSIGTNSPGKEKPKNDIDCEEIIEKKEIKAKRMLSLQKMCEAKGSMKKQELEDHREQQIKKKMLKRAERFKVMITQENFEVKGSPKAVPKIKVPSPPDGCVLEIKDETSSRIDLKKTLKLCNLFESVDEEIESKEEKLKTISIEDEEFLNKLSPSIRKKENMMSYFKKVPKGIDDDDKVIPGDNSQNIIKVKFTSKRKKKPFKKKLKSEINKSNHDSNTEQQVVEHHHDLTEVIEVNMPEKSTEVQVHSNSRPKRNSKRPAKYEDNVDIISSDDDLQIFTPKKKRNLNSEDLNNEKHIRLDSIDSISQDRKIRPKSNLKCKTPGEKTKNKKEILRLSHESITQEKSKLVIKGVGNQVKLAPIFISKQSPNISPAEKEAKQKFLQSGIPEKLRKGSSKQQSSQINDTFHVVAHVQQTSDKTVDNHVSLIFKFSEISAEEIVSNYTNASYKNLLKLNIQKTPQVSLTSWNKNELLCYIKKSYEKFPVYRTYHLLRGKSKGEFKDFHYPDLDNSVEIINGLASNDIDYIEKLCWVEKYKPNSTKQIIGNFGAIDELKKWLQTWTENLIKTRSQPIGSDGSDFSDFVDSDMDSRDTLKNNVLIISGEVGSGKTSCVYAVAAELAIKVIEVNASSKRTGKIMLQDLQEATRSHKVDRGKNSDCSQNVQEIFTKKESHKKRGRPKKVKAGSLKGSFSQKSETSETLLSQDSMRTDMSLILIDDADIVFDQDDGFCSAISQLIQSSKRPVILVTSSLSCPHLQKFVQFGKIITLHRFLPRMLGVWLDIMCIADIGTCCPGLGKSILDLFKGDIRKTINYLQFYMSSYKHALRNESSVTCEATSQDLDSKMSIDDESSSMSWADRECSQENTEISSEFILDKTIQQHMNTILNKRLFDLSNVWWSLPKILYRENVLPKEIKHKESKRSKELLTLSNMLDMVSLADNITPKTYERNCITGMLWSYKETASVDETDNYQYYNNCDEVREDIVSELVTSGLGLSHEEMGCKTSLDISVPGFSVEREQHKVGGRHHTLTNCLNPGAVLDKKALALDYWSTCRTICRLELNKTDISTKRNNRFCHYLKSLNVTGKNDYFDALSKSLSCSDNGNLL